MVDWNFQGRKLPSNDEEWGVEFDNYKKYPEYKRVHGRTMELDEFKRIYFIEWFHRMWGRSIGILFVAPMCVFAARGVLKPILLKRLTGLFALGATQGFIGWWMVRSGLDEPETNTAVPRVSAYRLTSHLLMATTLYAGVLWTSLSVLRPSPEVIHTTKVSVQAARRLKAFAIPCALIALTTVTSGGFVAGNDAGRAYNTWPKMLEYWVPPEVSDTYLNLTKKWRDIFESTPVVQFDHRMMAYATVISSTGLWLFGRRLPTAPIVQKSLRLLPLAAGGQMLLGITTLLMYVPVELGTLHQGGGIVVLTAYLALLNSLRLPIRG